MAVTVKPWYSGAAALSVPNGGGSLTIGTQAMSIDENIDKIDTTNTGSSKLSVNGQVIVEKTSIQAGTELSIDISGQYGSGNAGDPPNFASAGLYGNIPSILQAGDTFAAAGTSPGFNMLIDKYTVRYTKGEGNAIEYQLQGHSNGAFNRTTATT